MAMTLKNTVENIQMLEGQGYLKSSVSKPNGMNKNLRYDTNRKVYWFSSNRHYHPQDTDPNYEYPKTIIYFG